MFAVDYQTCRQCGLGWVEEPYTDPRYQRCGLAAAGLAALRAEYPGLGWHTLGGHLRDSEQFWCAVAVEVVGGYAQREICPHLGSRQQPGHPTQFPTQRAAENQNVRHPAGVPFHQLTPIPSGIPAKTGTPGCRVRAGSRSDGHSGGLPDCYSLRL